MKVLRGLYLEDRFFYCLSILVGLFILSYWVDFVFFLAQLSLLGLLVVAILDGLFLFSAKQTVSASRSFNPQMSMGDPSKIGIRIGNKAASTFWIELIEEAPEQLQIRHFSRKFKLEPGMEHTEFYEFTPVKRGEYKFGNLNVFLKTFLGVLSRREVVKTEDMAKVYPSIVQMKKYELKIQSKTASFHGIKKIRRLGNNNEFEQIKQYVQGDDFRVINWKATSRSNELMVNQYQDEKSQQVYCIIDKSRSMRMPFGNMSLLDYAINSTLTISNISMLKGDKAGIITFSDKLGSRLKAERSGIHLKTDYGCPLQAKNTV